MAGPAEVARRLTGEGGSDHLDEISLLYSHCQSKDLKIVAEALRAIGRVLSHHRHRCVVMAASPEGKSAATTDLAAWLKKHGDLYHSIMVEMATSANAHAQVCALRLTMEAISGEDKELRELASLAAKPVARPALPEKRLHDLISELLLAEHWSEHACACLCGDFLQRYADVRHFLFQHVANCCKQLGQSEAARKGGGFEGPEPKRARKASSDPQRFVAKLRERGLAAQEVFTRVFALLREAPAPEGKTAEQAEDADLLAGGAGDDDDEAGATLAPQGRSVGDFKRKYRGVFQDVWLQLLSLPVPLKQWAQVLQYLPENVIPHISRPLMLADVYLRAFHSGSAEVSVLSLSGLLLLLTKYGLGDPETLSSSCSEFYMQLYSLFTPETFRLRKRARFQRLAVASLTSGLLPARFAAVFAKKCMRVAICCNEPGTVMWLLSVAYGLIQKHHSHCKYLLHRPVEEGKPEETYDKDPFESDASLSTALEQAPSTSLWELQILQRHHLPAVVVLAKLFLRPFFKPSAKKLDPELFLDQSVEKSYRQALRGGERQLAKWKGRSEKCPMAFRLEENKAADDLVRLSALLSTSQRKLGAQG